MSDNTTLNAGTGGDSIRDIDRSSLGIKTQVVQLDLGGSYTNAENLITAGQRTNANSMPVSISSDQDLAGKLDLILAELKLVTRFIQIGLNIEDDPDHYRNDPSYLS